MHPVLFRDVARSFSEEAVQPYHRSGRQSTFRPRVRDTVASQDPGITILAPWDEPDFFDEHDRLACDELTIGLDYLFTEAGGFMSLLDAGFHESGFMITLDSVYDTVYNCLWSMLEACGQDPETGEIPEAYEILMHQHIHTITFATGRIMEQLALICSRYSPPRPDMQPLHTYIDQVDMQPDIGLYISFDFSHHY